jgi:hypothetical protein
MKQLQAERYTVAEAQVLAVGILEIKIFIF